MTKSSKPAAEISAPLAEAAVAQIPELVFPDWTGCERDKSLMTVGQKHRHSEQLLRRFNRPPRDTSLAQRCAEEFVL